MHWEQLGDHGFDVAIVGATGVVGQMLLRVMSERRFPIRRLRLLASERSRENSLGFRGRSLPIEPASIEAFEGAQLAFFAATNELSETLAPAAVAQGAIAIDKSSSFRLRPDVPLVVPEVNAHTLDDHRGIVACPNCTTTGLVMALEPLRRKAGLRSLVVTTLQAVSGAGRDACAEFDQQRRALIQQTELEPARCFPVVIADNVIAECGAFVADRYCTEEHKLLDETRKIFELPSLGIAVTTVRVPVEVGHSAAVLVETETALSVAAAREAYRGFSGVDYVESETGPTPRDVLESDQVLVGRVRRDFDTERLWLWEVSNNLRKGAATNALQIAEALWARGLVEPRTGLA
ncbi:MAG TPA: aspartate-semialdehyde dehydrogenase [Polyangiaceae bacterium]|nr:aspartate-semialdehyde dehydrogenase [Polyangiaceae bacterium]